MTIKDVFFTQGFDLVDIILSCVMGFILAADIFKSGGDKR